MREETLGSGTSTQFASLSLAAVNPPPLLSHTLYISALTLLLFVGLLSCSFW